MRSKSHRYLRRAAAVFAGALPLALASGAQAADCSTLPNPVYVAGSTAVRPFLAAVAQALAGATPPVTVVYQGQGSCVGVNYLASATPGTITGTGEIYSATGIVTGGCALDIAGNTVDIGVSDVYATSCPGVTTLPATVKDFFGPVQPMSFAVPLNSTQTVISAEAAYLTLGLGTNGGTEWSDPTAYQVRSATSGTQQMISAAIRVPAGQWIGVANAGSGNVLTALQAASASQATADLTFGILAMDVVDKNRATVRPLAYQHFGQGCGYTPDSTVNSFDKQNVRDGHYMIWGPLHMLTRTTGGQPSNANAKKVIDYLSGAVDPDFDLIRVEAKGGVVPSCAMRVTRDSEVGPLMSYMPPKSCECKFIAEATGAAPTECQACVDSTDCSSARPACNHGYCEVR